MSVAVTLPPPPLHANDFNTPGCRYRILNNDTNAKTRQRQTVETLAQCDTEYTYGPFPL